MTKSRANACIRVWILAHQCASWICSTPALASWEWDRMGMLESEWKSTKAYESLSHANGQLSAIPAIPLYQMNGCQDDVKVRCSSMVARCVQRCFWVKCLKPFCFLLESCGTPAPWKTQVASKYVKVILRMLSYIGGEVNRKRKKHSPLWQDLVKWKHDCANTRHKVIESCPAQCVA